MPTLVDPTGSEPFTIPAEIERAIDQALMAGLEVAVDLSFIGPNPTAQNVAENTAPPQAVLVDELHRGSVIHLYDSGVDYTVCGVEPTEYFAHKLRRRP